MEPLQSVKEHKSEKKKGSCTPLPYGRGEIGVKHVILAVSVQPHCHDVCHATQYSTATSWFVLFYVIQ